MSRVTTIRQTKELLDSIYNDNGESKANFDHYIMDEAGHSELNAMLENARKGGKVITVETTPGYEGVWIK